MTAGERREAILALLEEQPYHSAELAAILRCFQGAVHAICESLRKQGKLRRLPDKRWELAGAAPTVTDPAIWFEETKKPKQSKTRFEHERPESRTIKVDTEIAWWVGLDRQRFNDEIASRAGAMQQSKESRHVPFRMLQ